MACGPLAAPGQPGNLSGVSDWKPPRGTLRFLPASAPNREREEAAAALGPQDGSTGPGSAASTLGVRKCGRGVRALGSRIPAPPRPRLGTSVLRPSPGGPSGEPRALTVSSGHSHYVGRRSQAEGHRRTRCEPTLRSSGCRDAGKRQCPPTSYGGGESAHLGEGLEVDSPVSKVRKRERSGRPVPSRPGRAGQQVPQGPHCRARGPGLTAGQGLWGKPLSRGGGPH